MLQQNSSDFSSVCFHLGAMMGFISLCQNQEKKLDFTFPSGEEGYLERRETVALFHSLSVFWPFKISPQSIGVFFSQITQTQRHTDTHFLICCMSDSCVQRIHSQEMDMVVIKIPQCTETQILALRKSQMGKNKILTLTDCKASVICMPNKVKSELI